MVQGIFEAIQESEADEESYEETEYPRTCTEATFATRENGVYNILGAPMYCVVDYTNGHLNSWTVIFSRVDGTVDFNGNWEDYKNGFGYDDDYFFSLDWIHATTSERQHELMVILEDNEGNIIHQYYDQFAIGNEQDSYELHLLGGSKGTAGDMLRPHEIFNQICR